MNTLKQILLKFVLIASLFLLYLPAAYTSPLFDGSNANSWVIDSVDGNSIGSFKLGVGLKWSRQVNIISPNAAEVLYDPTGSNILNGLNLNSQSLLVNQTAFSVPAKTTGTPDVSLVGLGLSIGNPDDGIMPAVKVTPAQTNEVFDGTIELVFQVTVGRDTDPTQSSSPVLNWTVNGGQVQTLILDDSETSNFLHSVFLVQDGIHTVQFWASHNGVTTQQQTSQYEILAVDGLQRDSDGDGIPDLWEVENGLNPLQDSTAIDSDGDGWSDFDELMRGTDPNDANSIPLDSDFDGWSDQDEIWRQTNPNDINENGQPSAFPDKPTARRLYEVENRVSGNIYQDELETTVQPNMDRLVVMSLDGSLLYNQSTLPTAAELATLDIPLQESDLPLALQSALVDASLENGELPNEFRVPVGSPVVIRTTSKDFENWVVRDWIDNQLDLHPREVTDYLAENGTVWTTAEQWQEGYISYLQENLYQDQVVSLSPISGTGVFLIEAVIAWANDLSDGHITQLTELGGDQMQSAVDFIDTQLLLPRADTWNVMHTQLQQLSSLGQSLNGFHQDVLNLYEQNTTLNQSILREGVKFIQGEEAVEEYLYALRLNAFFGSAFLSNLPFNTMLSVQSLLLDTDSDGRVNRDEMGAYNEHLIRATNPLLLDTDGNGVSDANEVCVETLQVGCDNFPDVDLDSDGDGIVDIFDVCPKLSNPDQVDSNQDGIGDLCRFYANITTPIIDQTIRVGDEIDFNSIVTELGENKELDYEWNFDGGAADSTIANPGLTQFNNVGVFNISLIVSDVLTGNDLGTDSRIISVSESLIEPSIDDVLVDEDALPLQIDLSSVFFNGVPSTLNVENNSNPALVVGTFEGSVLTLAFQTNANGVSQITIAATANTDTEQAQFTVTVNPINDAPVFTSSDTLQLIDGVEDVDQVSASDIEDDQVSFLIIGGDDSALFDLSADGLLSFIVAPDKENPTDLNADGDYELIIQAYDGEDATEQAITITADVLNQECDFFIIRTPNGNMAIICI